MSDQDCEVRAGGDIIFLVDDGAAILQLNRPAKRNALSQAMWEAICCDDGASRTPEPGVCLACLCHYQPR